MKDDLLQTKLQRSFVPPDVLPRNRLLDRLEEGRHRPLTLISAPAGYGKSTLASRWTATCDCPSGWVSLDNDDNDLRQFLKYLLAAIQRLFPKNELRSETLLQGERLPATAELASYLLNDLHQVPESFILVLDDYQRIKESSVHDLVAALLEHPAQTMHLALLTRKDPSLPIATMRGRGLVTEIRASDLRFTPDEGAAFLSRMLSVAVDDDTAALLAAKIEGWAAGLRLAGLYLQGQKDLKLRVQELGGSSGHIAEYLAAEVLSRQHPEMVSYLLETSILNRFCAPLCGKMHLTGTQGRSGKPEIGSEHFIQWLVEANLFVIALDDQGYWFRYHHLFQDYLKDVLRKKRTADQIADLHRMAGNWFAENDLIEEAIRHLISAGDTSAAIQLVIDRRHGLMNASRFVRLHRWLALLPKKDVAEAPLLATTQAFIGIELGLDADAYMFTETAIRMLAALSPQSEMHPRLQAEVMVLQGFADLFIDDAHNCIVHAKSALHALPEHMEYIRSLGIGVLSVCHQMKGESDHAIAVTREALADTTLIVNMEARLHFYQCLVHYMDGDLNNMMNAARRCLQAIGNVPFHHTRTFVDYFLGTAYYLQNQPGEAETCLLKVLADRHAANPSYVAHACIILASIYFSRGEETAVERVIEQISIHCRENDYAIPLSTIQAFEVEIALRRGDIRQANQMCKQTDFETRPPIWFHYAPQLTPIKCLLAEGTEDGLKKARTRLIEWEERMRRINRVNVRVEILALLTLVCYKQRDEAAALEHLQTALELAEPGGWIRTFVDLGMPMIDVLKILVQHQPGQAYAQQTLEACQAEHRKIAHPEPDETTKPRISEQPPHNLLTPREIEILPLLAEGLSNKEIAARLYIVPLTVKTHLQNIYKKLNVKNRIEALEKAREIGIINNK